MKALATHSPISGTIEGDTNKKHKICTKNGHSQATGRGEKRKNAIERTQDSGGQKRGKKRRADSIKEKRGEQGKRPVFVRICKGTDYARRGACVETGGYPLPKGV